MMPSDRSDVLWERWLRNAERAPDREAVIVWRAAAEPFRWRWAALVEEATRLGRSLGAAGIRSGDVCGIILRHCSGFYPLYMAIESIGAIPSVLAYPNSRLHPDKFREGLLGMAEHSGLDWVLTEDSLRPLIDPLVRSDSSTVRGVLYPFDQKDPLAPPTHATPVLPSSAFDASAPCLLQHSSGTTGLQKAVILSHRAVLEHVASYAKAIDLRSDDKIVSWLPLYHDMGLIAAFHLPLALAVPTVHIDPFEWISAPGLLLDVLSRERGTLSWLPNFAFAFMAQRIRTEDVEGANLTHVRSLINCSEPVRAESQDVFFDRFQSCGLSRTAMSACYAMAETTFAATQTPTNSEPLRFFADRDRLTRGEAVPVLPGSIARICVSSGRPIVGCQVRIVNDGGQDLGEDVVGEIEITSRYLFGGYRGQPEKTATVLRDGHFLSGDLGFMRDGECYVVGRKKDIIIVAGKNVVPEDIEDALCGVSGVLPGRIVAFGLDDVQSGTEIVAIAAETELTGEQERKQLRLTILRRAMEIDVTVSRVYLAPPRWLVKSSAGKLSRASNRARAVAELVPI